MMFALALRLVGIAARPMWYDEAFSALFAPTGPDAMLSGTLIGQEEAAAEEHPLLYYSLLWGWMRVLGESPASIRGLSVLFGLAVVGMVYLIGKSLFDTRLGLLAAGMAAMSPFQIHYAQEVRMYVVMTFWILGAIYALWRGMHTRHWAWWLLFMICASLAQYTHNLSVFFLLPLAATPLLTRDRRAIRDVAISGAGALLLYIPWLIRVPAQFSKIQGDFWMERPSPARLLTTLLSFVTNLPLPGIWLGIGLFVTLFVTALGVWQTFRAWRSRDLGVRRSLWLGYLATMPVLLLYLFSLWTPIFIERALLPSVAIFLIWLGWAISQTGLPRAIQHLALLLLIAGMLMGIYNHITYAGFPYGPYAELDEYLAERAAPGDIILHSNKLTYLPMHYYDPSLSQQFLADLAGSGADTLAPATQAVLNVRAEPNIAAAVGEAPRVWFVIFGRAIDEYKSLGHSTHPQLLWMNSRFRLEAVSNWDDLQLYVYIRE